MKKTYFNIKESLRRLTWLSRVVNETKLSMRKLFLLSFQYYNLSVCASIAVLEKHWLENDIVCQKCIQEEFGLNAANPSASDKCLFPRRFYKM